MLSFDQLAAAAFAIDSGVRWVAVARPGEPPRYRYRPTVAPLNESASDEAEERLVNPAMIALAQGRGDWDLNGLRYIVIAYGKLSQVVAPLPEGGHISLSVDRGTDAAEVGETLVARVARDKVPYHSWAAAETVYGLTVAENRG
jgi:hypothetical protein